MAAAAAAAAGFSLPEVPLAGPPAGTAKTAVPNGQELPPALSAADASYFAAAVGSDRRKEKIEHLEALNEHLKAKARREFLDRPPASAAAPRAAAVRRGGGAAIFDTKAATAAKRLNAYREAYKDVISFRFRPQYSATDDPASLESDLDQVRALVNSKTSDTVLAQLVKSVGPMLQQATMALGRRAWVEGERTYEAAHAAAFDAGEFNDEIAQLGAEYGHYLGAGPFSRIFFKIGVLYHGVVMVNTRKLTPPTAAMNDRFSDL